MVESVGGSAPDPRGSRRELEAGDEKTAASDEANAGPGFVLLFDAPPSQSVADEYGRVCDDVSDDAERITSLPCGVRWSFLPPPSSRLHLGGEAERASEHLDQTLNELADSGHAPLFILPVSFDFGSQSQEWLTERVRYQQRQHPTRQLHYDAFDAAHPLLVQALTERASAALGTLSGGTPAGVGVLVIAGGAGDSKTRADTYQLMRLLWERLGLARGEVAFVRHAQMPVPEQVAACARSGLRWVCVSADFWRSEAFQYARAIVRDHEADPDTPSQAFTVPSEPVGGHAAVRGWLTQRCLSLYRDKRARLGARKRSPRYAEVGAGRIYGPHHELRIAEWEPTQSGTTFGGAIVAQLSTAAELQPLLQALGVFEGTERIFVKPTWHGYAAGTYTDPTALDALLSALPRRAVVIEGHSSGRNDGSADFDWEREARGHRVWIAQQEQEYLEKTGLAHTLRKHAASYLNVTEAAWNGQCADPKEVREVLEANGVQLEFPRLLESVPRALFDARGAVLISYARFKGPTRLSLSNLFGLIPDPLRSDWHGPNITHFARVCCDLAKLYGSLFRLYGIVESLHCAVRWDRTGLYRSRWGNYDLLSRPGVVCMSQGLADADVLAGRLQGQDITRSAFYFAVRDQLGVSDEAMTGKLPQSLMRQFG